MKGNAERYRELLIAAVEVHQLRIEVRTQLDRIAENIVARELISRDFDCAGVKDAFKLVDGTCGTPITEREFIKSTLVYKDVEIHLHNRISELGRTAMEHVLEGISPAQICNGEW